ncbi:MAG TPA: sigma 54-interacting transcriptional regulator [Candidatus Limnocylindrales bacterium]|nr:sigma 54-interacting transcriptional regulator [Candidatus Limnocylindrales bacterium]
MDLLPVILSIAQAEGPDSVLGQIIKAIMANEHVALARIWFLDRDGDCPVCGQPGDEMTLHMRASDGRPLEPGADWSQVNRSHHRVSLDSPTKLAQMVRTEEPVLIADIASDTGGAIDRGWAKRECIEGLIGHPLRFRGAIVGVMAVFLRVHPNKNTLDWLNSFSAHAAVAIGNCRAFQQIDKLRRQLELERDYLREEVVETGDFRDIVGHSPALTRVLQQIDLVAQTDSAVLIQGESGTGKELIARAIHQRSRRGHQPLIRVSCGSIPRELFESEFFGHVKGSFTSAIRDRIGRFQLADGGTLFLDEVGEIPLDLQSKLLRVLQEGEFERVGDDHTRRVNVRVIAATNRDLRTESEAGRFRLDLFYRLSVFPLDLPPLRERREDIPQLAAHLVKLACVRMHAPEPRLPRRELDRLQQYDWPGNVRELQHVIERAVILSRGAPLEFQLQDRPSANLATVVSNHSADFLTEAQWRSLERENLLKALKQAGGKVSGAGGAAELLGVNPNTLASRLRTLGILRSHGG